MLQPLQQFGKELGPDLVRGWESLAEGWRELERVVPIPYGVYPDKAEAEFRNGVLVVRLPKAPEGAPRRSRVH